MAVFNVLGIHMIQKGKFSMKSGVKSYLNS